MHELDVHIRPATLADAPALEHVHVTSWRATYPGIVPQAFLDSLDESEFRERWEQWLSTAPGLCVDVAVEDGAVLGFASGGPAREPLPGLPAEFYAIYVAPHALRRGIGAQLFRSLVRQLRAAGHAGMYVWVLKDNPATTFYQRMGGTPLGTKTIEIGGASLEELSFAWFHLGSV